MKTIPFTKMVAAGNDFLVIDFINVETGLPAPDFVTCGPGKPVSTFKNNDLSHLAIAMCDRHKGIGADGLLILEPSKKTDYKMRIINADGSEAEMCGNGARCLALYIVQTRRETKKQFGIETLAGTILAQVKGETAKVRLSDPKDYRSRLTLGIDGRSLNVGTIDTGVPHAVVFVDGLSRIDVNTIGRKIRYHQQFRPRGTNVDFVEQLNQNAVELRTYERGVEAETLACGTGAVAAGLIGFCKANPHVQNQKNAAMKVKTKSGEVLDVTFDIHEGILSNVWLKGSARFIAQGEYYV